MHPRPLASVIFNLKLRPWIYRDYHMTFFISDPVSALYLDISARDTEGAIADEGSDMKKAMLWPFYHYTDTRKHFWKLTDYNVKPIAEGLGKGYDVFQNCVIYIFYQPTRVISGIICSVHFYVNYPMYWFNVDVDLVFTSISTHLEMWIR